MKRVFAAVLFSVLGSRVALANLSVGVDSCEFYDQLESAKHCGADGYIQQFASPYCLTYLKDKNDFTPKGQAILRNIRFCLQEVLVEKQKLLNCQQLRDYGIASHEYCYIQGGYCELSQLDRLKVFWIAKSEALNPEVWAMINRVHKYCLKTQFEAWARDSDDRLPFWKR